ncbi:hypothetical protein [Plantactinospora sp. BB1]|uniref:hypothetical protein n=1 Tax=Plantactinospora sp. BB1 TaxID=2071627 RepID=UPI00131EEEBB|nr:hypothetical protein [Plantactinospora sp. BB1]
MNGARGFPMGILDTLAGWIRDFPLIPVEIRGVVWFPLLAVLVIGGLLLLVRRVLPWLGRLVGRALGVLAVAVGAVLLLPDLLVSYLYRRTGGAPPGLAYGYGDLVAELAIGLTRVSGLAAPAFARAARTPAVFVIVLGALWLWTWNHGSCPGEQAVDACVRPVVEWTRAFDS